MTSALLVSWAEDGLKEFLGRKRPTGLDPSGPGERSPLILPGLLVKAPSTRWASTVARRAGDTRGPAAFTLSRNQRKGGFAPPFGARRAWWRRRRRTHRRRRDGAGPGHGAGVRFFPSTPPLDTHARTHGSKAGRQHTRHSARCDIEARRAVHLHGAVEAMARWGAAG
jgi:hypothetical protein